MFLAGQTDMAARSLLPRDLGGPTTSTEAVRRPERTGTDRNGRTAAWEKEGLQQFRSSVAASLARVEWSLMGEQHHDGAGFARAGGATATAAAAGSGGGGGALYAISLACY